MVPGGADSGVHMRGKERSEVKVMVQAIEHEGVGGGQNDGNNGGHGGLAPVWLWPPRV